MLHTSTSLAAYGEADNAIQIVGGADDREHEAVELILLLQECLQDLAHANTVKQQLDATGIMYEDIFEANKEEVKELLDISGVAAVLRIRIIRALSKNPQSGVYRQEQSKRRNTSVVILSAEQNELVAGFNQRAGTVIKNVSQIEDAIVKLQGAERNVILKIEKNYEEMNSLLVERKTTMIDRAHAIKREQLLLLQSQLSTCSKLGQTTQHLQNELQTILTDSEVDIAERQDNINVFVGKVKVALNPKMDRLYFDPDQYTVLTAQLANTCKIEYAHNQNGLKRLLSAKNASLDNVLQPQHSSGMRRTNVRNGRNVFHNNNTLNTRSPWAPPQWNQQLPPQEWTQTRTQQPRPRQQSQEKYVTSFLQHRN